MYGTKISPVKLNTPLFYVFYLACDQWYKMTNPWFTQPITTCHWQFLGSGGSLSNFRLLSPDTVCCTYLYWTVLLDWLRKSKSKFIPVQAMEALRVARGSGSHIFRHSAHRWRQGCQPFFSCFSLGDCPIHPWFVVSSMQSSTTHSTDEMLVLWTECRTPVTRITFCYQYCTPRIWHQCCIPGVWVLRVGRADVN
jgi:hypothetical protein